MPATNLTDRFCATVKPEVGRRLAFADARERGLEFRVSEKGDRSWSLRYRTIDGRQRRCTLGSYPGLLLADARTKAAETKLAVRSGGDPVADQMRSRAAARAQPIKTFGDLFGAYITASEAGAWRPRNKHKRARSIADERGVYRRHIEKLLGPQKVDDITRADVRAVLRVMRSKGIGSQTLHAQRVIRQAFAYALAEDRVKVNPAAGLEPMAPINAKNRTLTDAELRDLWRVLANPSGVKRPALKNGGEPRPLHLSRPVAISLQLCALLLSRRNEIAAMRLDELDLDRALWLLPAERMKGGKAHLVPLPPRAVELICEAVALTGGRQTPYVFPSPRSDAKSIRADSLTHAMAAIVDALQIPRASPHDLRRTGSTALTSERLGIPPFIRSRVLSHGSDTGGGATVSTVHYDANLYVREKRNALAAWEGLLLEIVGELAPTSNVERLRRVDA